MADCLDPAPPTRDAHDLTLFDRADRNGAGGTDRRVFDAGLDLVGQHVERNRHAIGACVAAGRRVEGETAGKVEQIGVVVGQYRDRAGRVTGGRCGNDRGLNRVAEDADRERAADCLATVVAAASGHNTQRTADADDVGIGASLDVDRSEMLEACERVDRRRNRVGDVGEADADAVPGLTAEGGSATHLDEVGVVVRIEQRRTRDLRAARDVRQLGTVS